MTIFPGFPEWIAPARRAVPVTGREASAGARVKGQALAAIGWHALADGTVVYAVGCFGILAGEAIVAAFGAASLVMILWARRTLPD